MDNNNSTFVSNSDATVNFIDEVQDNNESTQTNFVVSTLEDENDGDFSTGDLSLREAIALANEQEGADTISFDSGLNGSIILTAGELSLGDAVTISGLGAENLTIDGSNSSRVFKVDDGNSETDIDVTIDGMTITNGLVTEEATDGLGGGIVNQENLTIVNSIITNNRAEDPSGGANTTRGGGIYTSGTLNLTDSIVSGNDAIYGGGIFSLDATVSITNSSIDNNYAGFVGGGLYHEETELNLTNSTVTTNEASFAFGGVAIKNSTGNISYSTVSNNVAQNSSSGGINFSDSTGNISHSTISGNTALRLSGGGININSSTVNVDNSTISNNTANTYGGGIFSGLSSSTNLSNSTISGNLGIQGGSGVYQRPELVIEYDQSVLRGNVNLESTIIAGNVNNDDLGGAGFDSDGNNLIGNGEGVTSGSFVSSQGDIVGTADNPLDPNLGELQDNGGVTETQALLEDSPAIDAGSNPNNLTTDQRGEGFNRTIGSATDIGAFEVQDLGVEIPTELVVSTLEDENDGDFGIGDLSLREAIALANEQEGADIITFDSSLNSGTIVFDSSLDSNLNIIDSLSIVGLGQDNLTLDGGFIFNIAEPNIDVAIDGLNIVGGTVDSSGNLTFANSTISQTLNIKGSSDYYAILSRGNTIISDSTVKDNSGGANVGIVVESGITTIEGSAIVNNDSTDYAQSGVIVRSGATVDISNSTIANNRGRSTGGIENAGTANITNSTIANNTGGLSAGGINNLLDGTVTLTSSIVTNNTGGSNIGDVSGDGEFISGGNNLISNGDDAVGFVNGINGDLVGSNGDDPFNPQSELLIDPRLGNLQDNGGLTETFALLEDSPAIDAGSNPNNLTTDQRGEGFNRTVGDGTDIGAFEVQTIISAAEIIGTPGNDFLQGSGENDRIQGLDGKDVIQGLDGNDFLSGDNDNDFIEGGNGDDDVIGGEGDDLLNGGNDNDVLIGGEGNDRIFAGNGNDTIDDGAGNDILFGGAGSDRFVNSNSGNDLLIGGDDRDLFIFNLNPGAGFFDRDRIIDFQTGTDAIGFRPVVDAPQSFDNFDDLDTDGSGILDELDQRVTIIGSSTTIDFSDLFGRPFNSDTITLVGATDLSSDDFLFATTI